MSEVGAVLGAKGGSRVGVAFAMRRVDDIKAATVAMCHLVLGAQLH